MLINTHSMSLHPIIWVDVNVRCYKTIQCPVLVGLKARKSMEAIRTWKTDEEDGESTFLHFVSGSTSPQLLRRIGLRKF
jgi:hypothetical protein